MLSLLESVKGIKGIPIAFVSGGKLNNQIVYLHRKPPMEAEITEEEAYKILGVKPGRVKERLTKVELKSLNTLIHEKKVSNKRMKEVLKQTELEEKNNLGTEVKLEGNAMFIPVPNIEKRECQYISGCSGSGKSRYCALYMRQWKKLFPDGKIYLFSDKDFDPAYEGISLTRVNIRELVKIPGKLDELNFENALVVFDDIDTIMDKKMSTIVQALQRRVLELCRQFNTYNLNINHLNNEGHKTRTFLNECDRYVFFPSFGNETQMEYFMTKSIGLFKRAREKIQKLEGWVIFNQRPPVQYFMNKDTIYLKKEINEKKEK